MARQPGPSVRSRRLVMLLARLRVDSGLSRADLAKSVGMSPSKITRIESMEIGIYRHDLLRLLDFYQIAESGRIELLDLLSHAEERGWLRLRGDVDLPDDWQTWVDFEADATVILNYEPLRIPGFLQTPDYARAIIQSTNSDLSDAEVDKLVTSRIARQVRLSHAHPLKLHAIIEENALTRPFCDTQSQVRQLRHLADFATYPNVLIQVLPIGAGLHSALNGSFVILEYGNKTRLVHLEDKVTIVYLDEEEQIEMYTQTWDELCALAYNPEKSVDSISAIAAQVDRKN
jgi:transcriptional regulator with XRE-family HTH domain